MVNVDTGIDDGDFHSGARVADANLLPGVGHMMQGQGTIQPELKSADGIHARDARNGLEGGGFLVRNTHDEGVGYSVDTVQNLRLSGFEPRSDRALLFTDLRAPPEGGCTANSRGAGVVGYVDRNRVAGHLHDVMSGD